jgi:putative ABC transport system ATP-binding protein
VIQLSHISRVFEVGGTPVHALKDFSLEIPPRSYVSLMGPSGSGKSTLLNILGLLDHPTGGSYRFDGKEMAELDDAERTRLRRHTIGFVFQTFHLIPRLTALANVELPMIFAGVLREERLRRARESLAAVGLTARAHHRQSQLSGGERQRVAIARAVVMRPSLLLADEPTGNLDRAAGAEVIQLLEDLHEGGLTLILVTHDPALGKRAQRQIVLADGELVQS